MTPDELSIMAVAVQSLDSAHHDWSQSRFVLKYERDELSSTKSFIGAIEVIFNDARSKLLSLTTTGVL